MTAFLFQQTKPNQTLHTLRLSIVSVSSLLWICTNVCGVDVDCGERSEMNRPGRHSASVGFSAPLTNRLVKITSFDSSTLTRKVWMDDER